MRIVFMGISLSLAGILVFFGITLLAKKNILDKERRGLEQEITYLNQKIDSLTRYEDSDPQDLESIYFEFCNAVKMIASFNSVESWVTIPQIKDGVDIRTLIQESSIQGVSMLPIKVSFQNLKGSTAYFLILGAFTDLGRRQPLKITEVHSTAGKLEIFINLYGV